MPARLNQLYNAYDAGISTAIGEGRGLPVFEQAATGAPQIVPDHTSFTENWSGAALMMPTTGHRHVFYEHTNMHATSVDHVVEALTQMDEDPTLMARLGTVPLDRVRRADRSWQHVCSLFSSIVTKGTPPCAVSS